MVAYGHMAYLIRISPTHRPRELHRLSDFGEDRVDLFEAIASSLDGLGAGFHKNPGLAEGFRKHSHTSRGRSLFVKLRRGPIGNPGETFDTEEGTPRETSRTTALLSELRASFYIPEDAYFGFLFVERVGGRHLKDLIWKRVLKPIALETKMVMSVEAFALSDDWRKELAGKQVLRVSELLKQKDSGHDRSTREDIAVRVSAEGAGLSSRGDDLKLRVFDIIDRRHKEYRALAKIAPLEQRRTRLVERTRRDGTVVSERKKTPQNAFTVSDEAGWASLVAEIEALRSGPTGGELHDELQEILPVDRDEYESQRLEVSFGIDRPEKTFVVAGDRVPQLIYEVNGWLTDNEWQAAWDATSSQFLGTLDVRLPTAWPLGKP